MTSAPEAETSGGARSHDEPPLVSVVVPAYQAMPFLPVAVASALHQSHPRIEVIVVDDGSTDGTAAWTASVDDPRVRVIRRTNGGCGAARNTGVLAAAGTYVAFLDADDIWEPDKIAAQVARAERARRPTLVDTWAYYIDAAGRRIGVPVGGRHEGEVWREMVARCLVRCGSTLLVPRRCFDVAGLFREDLPNAEDWEMWIRLTRSFPFAVVPRPLVGYRQHPAGKHNDHERLLDSMLRVVDAALPHPRSVRDRLLRRRARSHVFLHIAARVADQQGNGREAISLAGRAVAHRPRLLATRRCTRTMFQGIRDLARG